MRKRFQHKQKRDMNEKRDSAASAIPLIAVKCVWNEMEFGSYYAIFSPWLSYKPSSARLCFEDDRAKVYPVLLHVLLQQDF